MSKELYFNCYLGSNVSYLTSPIFNSPSKSTGFFFAKEEVFFEQNVRGQSTSSFAEQNVRSEANVTKVYFTS